MHVTCLQAAPGDASQFNYWGLRPSHSNQPLRAAPCDGSLQQQFEWVPETGELVSAAHHGLCVAVRGCGAAPGMAAVLQACDAAQLRLRSDPCPPALTDQQSRAAPTARTSAGSSTPTG